MAVTCARRCTCTEWDHCNLIVPFLRGAVPLDGRLFLSAALPYTALLTDMLYVKRDQSRTRKLILQPLRPHRICHVPETAQMILQHIPAVATRHACIKTLWCVCAGHSIAIPERMQPHRTHQQMAAPHAAMPDMPSYEQVGFFFIRANIHPQLGPWARHSF